MATGLMCGLIFIYFQGNFGWCGMPFAFQVVTTVLVVCISCFITGLVCMYCDDLIAVSHRDCWLRDRDIAVRVMRDLLGEDAEEPVKRESSEDNADWSVVVLGWLFCFVVGLNS
jgi:hypothetical protein